VALAVRLLAMTVGHTYRINPRRDHFEFGWEIGRIARSIATGQGFSSPVDLPTGPTAWAAPLYPYLLAGIFRAFGVYTHAAAWVVFAVNSIFSSLTSVTLYALGRRAFNETTARWTAWTWALFPYTIYWAIRVVWETSLSALLLSVVVLLTLRLRQEERQIDWWLLGLLWGVIGLTNPSLLSFFPVSLIWLLFRERRGKKWVSAAISVVIAFAVISPWIVRNYRVFGRFIFVRDNFGLELHVANNEQSDGQWTRSEHPGNDPAQMRQMQQMGESQYMQAELHKALQFIRAYPGRFLVFTCKRVAYFWAGKPQWTVLAGYNLAPARHVGFLLTALLPFLGLLLAVRHRLPGAWLFALLLITFPLPYYFAHSTPRYRHPIEPEMILLAIYFIEYSRTVQVRRGIWGRDKG
jgi:4-amino-4-deoxy-L-arabinose transferase-like glycosyltransferase